ncbi:MAG: type II secretion system minor pseudopilin GspI [Betaproteobacteria bacterium]
MTTRGFTLIEVLVALAIIAVALAAGMRVITQSADGASSLRARTLALWVAENQLARAQLEDPAPPAGTTDGAEAQAGVPFAWRRTVSASPNPAFRRIDIDVAAPDAPDYRLAHVAGYVAAATR